MKGSEYSEEIIDLYVNKKDSLNDIANKIGRKLKSNESGISTTQITKILKLKGVKLRPKARKQRHLFNSAIKV